MLKFHKIAIKNALNKEIWEEVKILDTTITQKNVYYPRTEAGETLAVFHINK
jgi:hypothetical protein